MICCLATSVVFVVLCLTAGHIADKLCSCHHVLFCSCATGPSFFSYCKVAKYVYIIRMLRHTNVLCLFIGLQEKLSFYEMVAHSDSQQNTGI